MTVRFVIPGRAFDAASEGNWPQDNPKGWAALSRAEVRRVGRGRQYAVEMLKEDAEDLADYLWSVSSLWREISATERGSDDPRPLERAQKAIGAAVAQPGLTTPGGPGKITT